MKLNNSRVLVLSLLLIAIVTVVSYMPSVGNTFATGVEYGLVAHNPHICVVSWHNFGTLVNPGYYKSQGAPYMPLVLLMHTFEYHYGGLNPEIFMA